MQALLVAILAVLPGALYAWGFEREVGRWFAGWSDRLLLFLGTSAVFHALFASGEYLLYSNYLHRLVDGRYRNLIWEGADVPWALALVPIAYVAIPNWFGTVVGRAVRSGETWPRFITGPSPAPRAWDSMFSETPRGMMRLKLKSGEWVGGWFGPGSYAAGYPEPQDLLIESVYRLDSHGAFETDDSGAPVPVGSSLLVRWEEVELLEFFRQEVG